MPKPEIKILNIDEPDFSEWKRIVDKLPSKDGFLTAEYALISKEYFGNQPLLFLYKKGESQMSYFFIKRRINDLPFAAKEILSEDYFDIISPEYGGATGYFKKEEEQEDLLKDFFKEFDLWCFRNNVVSEFCRLNPFSPLLEQVVSLREAQKNREVVYINLIKDKDQIWQGFRKGAKSSIKKAQREGVEIKKEKSKEFVDKMYQIYTKTMERRGASREYFHSQDFFDLLVGKSGDKIELFTAHHQNKLISASLFLTYGDVCHYFFSGTEEQYFHLSPNNLILNEAIFWAKDRGHKIFHLGGGYEPKDSLLNFKLSFSKETADFFAYQKIHNPEIYKLLCQARNKYDQIHKIAKGRSDYFPEYRK